MSNILIILVRYRLPMEQSTAIESLARCFAEDPSVEQRCTTLIWDNSPEPLDGQVPPFPAICRHTPENVGVSGAYNRALELAEQRGDAWLLLLDQDTTLSTGFLQGMVEYAERLHSGEPIAAVAPSVVVAETFVSPKITSRWRGAVDPPPEFRGAEWREVVLVNSGLLLRVAALRQIGGFSEDFWLDFSDRYVCHMLARHGFGVWLAGELRLIHNVSLMTMESDMSAARFANYLAAEDAYFSLYKSLPRNLIYCQRLIRKAWQRKAHPERAKLLMQHLLRRLTVSRERRLREWRAETGARRASMTG